MASPARSPFSLRLPKIIGVPDGHTGWNRGLQAATTGHDELAAVAHVQVRALSEVSQPCRFSWLMVS
jgi:hypothetical protein